MHLFRQSLAISKAIKENGTRKAFFSSLPYYLKKKSDKLNFFSVVSESIVPPLNTTSIVKFLSEDRALTKSLQQINPDFLNNYLFNEFVFWSSSYITHHPTDIENYFLERYDLNSLARKFIKFCFSKGIQLDAKATLDSFDGHNQLAAHTIEGELLEITEKEEVNIFGFGLDDGAYEKSLKNFLISTGKAQKVNLYGFDPYATQSEGIRYLSQNELRASSTRFDLITARWVLHHVALGQRWVDLINAINHCSVGARILILEHGFLKYRPSSKSEKQLYYLLNAFFDVVANIGLRPRYFTDTKPNIGANFFIHYLNADDLLSIKDGVALKVTQTIYDIGPGFPN